MQILSRIALLFLGQLVKCQGLWGPECENGFPLYNLNSISPTDLKTLRVIVLTEQKNLILGGGGGRRGSAVGQRSWFLRSGMQKRIFCSITWIPFNRKSWNFIGWLPLINKIILLFYGQWVKDQSISGLECNHDFRSITWIKVHSMIALIE